MKLNEMLRNITPLQVIGDAEMEIKGVNIDSRKIQHGHLFVAVKGTQVDGHQYIDKAIEQGATAVLCETLPQRRNFCAGCRHRRCRWQGGYLILW